jgi:hypothetical protein
MSLSLIPSFVKVASEPDQDLEVRDHHRRGKPALAKGWAGLGLEHVQTAADNLTES